MNDPAEDYFAFQKKLLKIIGVSLEKENGFAFKCYSRIVFLITISHCVFTFAEIFLNGTDLDSVVYSVTYAAGTFKATCKFLMFYFQRTEFQRIFNSFKEDVFLPNYKRGGRLETELIKKCVKNGRRQGIVIVSLVYATFFSGTIGTLIKRYTSGDTVLPFSSFSCVDTTSSPNYELVWLYQTVAYFLVAISYLTMDIIFVNCCYHITVQCKMLQNFILSLSRTSYYMKKVSGYYQNEIEDSYDKLQQFQKEVVVYHDAIINLANKFSEVAAMYFLLQYIGTLLMLCTVLYHLSTLDTFDFRLVKDVCLLSFLSINTFMLSYWSNEVTISSQLTGEACWETNFVGTDIRFQKGLRLITKRSQKSIEFTVGKVAPLNLMTSVAMLRAAVSYYMVLRSVKKTIEI